MRTFEEVVPAAFTLQEGRWVFRFGPEDRYSLEVEPILGGGWLVALYEQQPGEPHPVLLLPDKLPVRAIVRGDQGGSNVDAALASVLRLVADSHGGAPGAAAGPETRPGSR